MTSLYRLKPNLLIQAVAEETVILDPDSGEYFTLDPVATRMVEGLRQQLPVARIAQELAAEYEVEAGQVEKDFDELMETMVQQGLVERAGG